MDMNKAYALRARAQAANLRNRVISTAPHCECGNLLTIEDVGYRCRQCRILDFRGRNKGVK